MNNFRFTEKLSRKDSFHIPFPQSPLWLTSCISVVHLLQVMSRYWYLINEWLIDISCSLFSSYALSLCPCELGHSCCCCHHSGWVIRTAGPSHVDFNGHLKCLQKRFCYDMVSLWNGKFLCVWKGPQTEQWGRDLILVKQILVFGERLQYHIFLQSNNRIFIKPRKRKTLEVDEAVLHFVTEIYAKRFLLYTKPGAQRQEKLPNHSK